MLRRTAIAALLTTLLSVPGAALAASCGGTTLEAALAALAEEMQLSVIRVQIRTKSDGQDRAAIDRTTRAVAAALMRAGAYAAEPIEGQPLIVAELGKQQLLDLARDERIACVTRDSPEAPN